MLSQIPSNYPPSFFIFRWLSEAAIQGNGKLFLDQIKIVVGAWMLLKMCMVDVKEESTGQEGVLLLVTKVNTMAYKSRFSVQSCLKGAGVQIANFYVV